MHTENRSSNTEQMVSVPREVIEFAVGFKAHGYKNLTEQLMDQQHAQHKLRAILDHPAQRQGEPVKTPARDESLGTAERDEYANGYRHGWNAYNDEMAKLGPLYTHSDSGEVERLRAELDQRNREKSARQDLSISLIDEARSLRAEVERLREELGLIKISFDRNFDAAQEAKAERDTLRAQLANWQALAAERLEMITGRDALLRDLDEAWNAHDGEKLFGKLMMKVEALSASAELKPICETCQGTWSKEQCQGCFK